MVQFASDRGGEANQFRTGGGSIDPPKFGGFGDFGILPGGRSGPYFRVM